MPVLGKVDLSYKALTRHSLSLARKSIFPTRQTVGAFWGRLTFPHKPSCSHIFSAKATFVTIQRS